MTRQTRRSTPSFLLVKAMTKKCQGRLPAKKKDKPRKAYSGRQKKNVSHAPPMICLHKASTSWTDCGKSHVRSLYLVVDREQTFSSSLSHQSSPLDAFELYFKEEVINYVTQQTNLYARQMGRSKWTDVTCSELRAYFGMLVIMSINPFAPSSALLVV